MTSSITQKDKGWCLNGLALGSATLPLNPSQSLTTIDSIKVVSFSYPVTGLDGASNNAINEGLLSNIGEYINNYQNAYMTEDYGWVYLQDSDISTACYYDGTNFTNIYTISAKIVFYKNNNIPATSPSGV